MKNMRAFKVVYKGPTNTRGSRVIITDLRFKVKTVISYNYEMNDVGDMAEVWLKKLGITIKYQAENANEGYILLTDDFTTQIIRIGE